MAQTEVRVSYGNADRIIGVLLCCALAAVSPILKSLAGRSLLAVAIFVAVFGTLQAFTRMLILFESGFVVRDVFGRRHTYTYSDVAAVEFDPESVLAIRLTSDAVIRFPAKLRNIEQARAILMDSVTGSSH